MLNWKVIWGLVKHDLLSYVNSYKVTCEWAKKYPGIPADDFAALQDAAWTDLEAEMQAQADAGEGSAVLRTIFTIPDTEKN